MNASGSQNNEEMEQRTMNARVGQKLKQMSGQNKVEYDKLMYAQNAVSVNVFHGNSRDKIVLDEANMQSLTSIHYSFSFFLVESEPINNDASLGGSQTVVSEEYNDKDGKQNGESELKQEGVVEDRLQLLVNVTGAFRPSEPNCGSVRRLEYLVKFLLGLKPRV
nr:hypothetical protein [Tanacetum cinerariifolium]